jgi:hypothetical protein
VFNLCGNIIFVKLISIVDQDLEPISLHASKDFWILLFLCVFWIRGCSLTYRSLILDGNTFCFTRKGFRFPKMRPFLADPRV